MGKTVFITGGSSGIGGAVAKALGAAGWRVVAPSHEDLDLADLEAVRRFTSSDKFPAEDVDALVHVAGVWHDKVAALADKPFGSFSAGEIERTMNVGLTSFMLLANQLIANGQPSHIIGISGTFESGAKGWLPYYTSKRALEDFLVGLAQDEPKLMVYGISPSDTATPAYQRFYPEYAKSAQSPEAVGNLVVSLLDGKSKHKSGSIIEVRDGQQKPGFHS